MNYTEHCPKKTKNVIGLMKDVSGAKIITEFVPLKPKAYSSSVSDSIKSKKQKTQKVVWYNENLSSNIFKIALKQIDLKINKLLQELILK